MKCRKCGAELLSTDTFCVNCGHKVEPAFCPSCGEKLREGTKFCHKCGAPVAIDELEDDAIPIVQQKTVDIPFEQIEQGILFEATKVANEPPRAMYQGPILEESENGTEYAAYSFGNGEQRSYGKPAYGGEAGDNGNEEDDYEEDDYEDDYEDDDKGGSFVSKLSVILGIVILFIALAVAFFFWKNNGGFGEKENQETQEQEEQTTQQEEDNEQKCQGRIQVLKNVNVRDYPGKDKSSVLFVAQAGETYEYYEKDDNGWYHIKISDSEKEYTEGYVYGDYVESLD